MQIKSLYRLHSKDFRGRLHQIARTFYLGLKAAYDAKLSVSKLIDNVVSVITGCKKQEISAFIKWVLELNDLLAEM